MAADIATVGSVMSLLPCHLTLLGSKLEGHASGRGDGVISWLQDVTVDMEGCDQALKRPEGPQGGRSVAPRSLNFGAYVAAKSRPGRATPALGRFY
jgi:hypothetical protein